MNKTDLIASVSASTGMPQEAAHRAVNATIEIIIDAIQDGDSVNIPGLIYSLCPLCLIDKFFFSQSHRAKEFLHIA